MDLQGRIPVWKLEMHANSFNEIQKTLFITLRVSIMLVAIDWTDSKAVAITALEICVFTKMVHGGSWKSITTERTLVSFQTDVSFVWSHFLFCVCHQEISPHRSLRWSRKIKKWMMVCFIEVIFIFQLRLTTQFVLLCFTSHCILSGSRWHMSINSSK